MRKLVTEFDQQYALALKMENFKKDNHFVPKMYLRQWSEDGIRVHMYRLLVSSETVPLWKLSYIKGIARHEHLYTRIVGGAQSDEFERWIGEDFESPAATAIEMVAKGLRLSKDEWWNLVRFLAAQDVRTPARLIESLKRWHQTVPSMIEDTTRRAILNIEKRKESKKDASRPPPKYSELLPIRVHVQPNENGVGGALRVETDIGRGYWLFQMKHLLTKTANILHKHRWSMIIPPGDVEWITSDDPVIKLNFQAENQFDFGGGWDSQGSEILMPVSPKRLMYTRIGDRKLPREIFIDLDRAQLINRMIIRHAHRLIFATQPREDVSVFRPRKVDMAMVNDEKRQWSEWAADSSK